MEPIDYPEIVLLTIEEFRQDPLCPHLLLDPDWVTTALFNYQNTDYQPLNETHQDCIWGAENIKPRSEWNITPEQAKSASERQRQKWLKEREERKKQWGR